LITAETSVGEIRRIEILRAIQEDLAMKIRERT
jgi:hypothetical protein